MFDCFKQKKRVFRTCAFLCACVVLSDDFLVCYNVSFSQVYSFYIFFMVRDTLKVLI
nr:MAG TPA: hypothetical protein [Caudoviricetes sp.]